MNVLVGFEAKSYRNVAFGDKSSGFPYSDNPVYREVGDVSR
jgi:hypothetical protein